MTEEGYNRIPQMEMIQRFAMLWSTTANPQSHVPQSYSLAQSAIRFCAKWVISSPIKPLSLRPQGSNRRDLETDETASLQCVSFTMTYCN